MAWVTIVITCAILGYLVCSTFTWQDGLVYRLLNLLRDYIVFVCATVILAGWVVISYQFIARYAVRELEALADAAEQLVSPQDEPISLPDSLGEVEVQLNAARERALRDARAAREAEQRKNDLVVYLAHDLKTPAYQRHRLSDAAAGRAPALAGAAGRGTPISPWRRPSGWRT